MSTTKPQIGIHQKHCFCLIRWNELHKGIIDAPQPLYKEGMKELRRKLSEELTYVSKNVF